MIKNELSKDCHVLWINPAEATFVMRVLPRDLRIYDRLIVWCFEGWVPVNRFNKTSWMTVIAPTGHLPKSVRNRCVIEVFGGVFVLICPLVFDFSVDTCIRVFVIGMSQISFFSS